MERLIVEVPSESVVIKTASCPNGHSLMNTSYLLSGRPTIHLILRCPQSEVSLYLDPRYGSFDVAGDDLPQNGTLPDDVVCPTCRVSLLSREDECLHCGAPLVTFHLPHEGLAQACSRAGCPYHRLRIKDISARIADLLT